MRKISAGTVNTTPPAIDSPAEPIVWTMLFSRIVEPPSFLSTGDREHGDRDRRADREARAEPEINRRCAKQQAEK